MKETVENMKPSDREVPSIGDFAFITSDKIRYCDTDRQGHVNNAVFSSFFETGRTEILYNPAHPLACPNCSFVIARIQLDFLNEITWPGEIMIGTRISKIGKSSLQIEQGLYQKEKCVAFAQTAVVQVNEETKKSVSLDDEAIKVLSKLRKE